MSSKTIQGLDLRTRTRVAVTMQQGRITSIERVPGDPSPADPWIAPPLVDLQVNGFAGIDF
ncbi:MAG TPA: N-acetylglucosamine-6-phosphate deacetylase, partial [Verrucomicrobiales bacterium]|nr:N-acetylglucosamine-6-phosphate deacetylase [Verrucomicrobiales bacterium]